MVKRLKTTYWIICFTLAALCTANAQDMSNTSCGKVNNGGRISVRGTLQSVLGASIENKDGYLICGGNTEIRQAEILGHVEYIEDSVKTQLVPQIRHAIVRFSGNSPKLLDTSYNGNLFVSMDTMISRAEVNLLIHPRYPLISWGRITHDGTVNENGPDASIILQGTNAQNIDGLGTYKTLELDNTAGVYVINKGGFGIQNNLYLHRGVFHNTDDNNLTMLNNSLITRSDESSIETHPALVRRYSLRYVGIKEIVSANEVPLDSGSLKSMTVHNNGGLTMSRDIIVNDSLVVGRDSTTIVIRTDLDTARHTLSFARSDNDPEYPSSRSEVIGNFRRSSLRTGGSFMVYNNRHTGFLFSRPEDMNGAVWMSLDSRPVTFPVQGNGTQKVERKFIVSARDANDSLILKGLRYRFAYAWVNNPSLADNESNNLDVSQVILQRWDDKRWANYKSSIIPATQTADRWAFSTADSVGNTGFFAIGMPTPVPPMLASRVLMEGPYRNGSMAADLLKHNLIPSVPPNIFPYTLDDARTRDTIAVIPQDVVDWVVVELRKSISAKADFVKTGFLLRDGSIINPDGRGLISFPDTLSSRDYYVVVHHRNHLSMMTSQPWRLVDEDAQIFKTLDFTDGLNVLGGFSALKPICFGPGEPTVFAMVAGDVNGDGVIDDRDRSDYDSIYTNRDREAYINQDTDMSGIVTTRDINKTWNNRTRSTNVPRQ